MKFDPIIELLVAQSRKPKHLIDLNLRVLTPFQRTLLVIDGTVTKYIEAYTMEPVDVIRISQEELILDAPHEWLEAPAGTCVLARQVLLKGRYNSKIYAYAASLIITDRIAEKFKQGLEDNPGGIGRVILNNQLETRREVLWYGKENGSALPETIDYMNKLDFISRAYRIINNGKPIMLINEKFPMGEELVPAHE